MEKEIVKNKIKSSQLIPLSFLVAIVIGTLVLMLPISSATGEWTDPITALFTATTSLCVTGLVVVDTFSFWSLFGKIFILIMIQLGGLGIITVMSVLMLAMHKRFSLSHVVILHDAFNLSTLVGLRRFLTKVFISTLIVEGFGAFIYSFVFVRQFGFVKGIWVSVFTAISAFCNAGIDIIGPDSLISYNDNWLIMLNTIMLIVLGGLGYVVWFDMYSSVKEGIRKGFSIRRMFHRFSEHSKLVIVLTVSLILSGGIIVFITEYTNPDTIGNMALPEKILNSIFQSVTFRTAGFAAVPQNLLRDDTCALGAIFMFIGGSPVGTAGGVKTITFFVVLLNAVSYIRSRDETVIFSRKISKELIQKSTAILVVSFGVTFIMLILLLFTNPVGLTDAMYETFSATATVGLSRALTPTLNTAGRLIIIVCMYLGRIGPISMALFFNYKSSGKNNVSFTKGNYFVG